MFNFKSFWFFVSFDRVFSSGFEVVFVLFVMGVVKKKVVLVGLIVFACVFFAVGESSESGGGGGEVVVVESSFVKEENGSRFGYQHDWPVSSMFLF